MAGEGIGVEARAQEVVAGQQPITGDTGGQILMVMTIQGQQGEPEALLQEARLEAGAAAGACCAWAMRSVHANYLLGAFCHSLDSKLRDQCIACLTLTGQISSDCKWLTSHSM